MNVEIIVIGNELLIGQVVDTNSSWMGVELSKYGFHVSRKVVISDNADEIKESLNDSLKRVDLVFITGGLGPTKDDITKATLADYFGMKLKFNKEVFENIKTYLNSNEKDINKLNRSQAVVPDGCEIIQNSVGTAPIMWFKQDGNNVISLPGVPLEVKTVMNEVLLCELKKRLSASDILHRTLPVYGIPESELALKIKKWESELPDYIDLAYLPSPGKVRIRLTGKYHSLDQLNITFDNLFTSLKKYIGDYTIGFDNKSLEVKIGDFLNKKGQTISCAESCTGGNIAHSITKIPGSSSYFYGGVVAYDNKIKNGVLGVKNQSLEKYGAVSKQVVEEMALGVKKLMNTTWAVATSGIAGPGGGTKDKPVGTVWIAWAGPNGVESHKYIFGTNRINNITASTEMGLFGLLKMIKNQ